MIELPKIEHVYLCLGYELRAWELIVMPDKLKKPFTKLITNILLILQKA